MKINCQKCKKHLGEIRDATLRKGIVYLCRECNTQRVALEMMKQNEDRNSNPFGGMFGSIFR
jgi:predicted SprT family Zn-dependent metalloprotease